MTLRQEALETLKEAQQQERNVEGAEWTLVYLLTKTVVLALLSIGVAVEEK